MITGSFEYNRPIRIVRETLGRAYSPVHYDEDLNNTHLDLELQDKSTGDFYPDTTMKIVPTIISGPVGGVTVPEGDSHHAVFEFTLNKPANVPTGSCWIVEWNTSEYEALDYFEFELLENTSDEVYIENLPFA